MVKIAEKNISIDPRHDIHFNRIKLEAEVECGLLGGRLASFVEKPELDAFKTTVQPRVTGLELWLGKFWFCQTVQAEKSG
jgi:hypothetical protein